MKNRIALACLTAALCAALPAAAQHPQGGRRMQGPPPGQRQFTPPAQRQFAPPNRDAAPDDRRGRLTPEERQQLRRDINQHGREVYRDGRR